MILMSLRARRVVACLCLFVALALRPGHASTDPSANGAFLRPYTNQWSMSVKLADGRVVDAGVWHDRLELTTTNGRSIGRRTQVEDLVITPDTNAAAASRGLTKMQVTTVNEFVPETMAPVSRDVTDSLGRHSHIDFRDGKASITRTGLAPRPDYSGEAVLAPPVFDYIGGLYGLLIVTLPLQSGFECDVPVLRMAPGAEDRAARGTVHVKVTGRATLRTTSGRSFETWTVEAEGLEFFVSREAPYIIRLVDRSRPGQVWTFDMI